MKTYLLLLALLPFAAAECPNACSGNGECGRYDSCTCYAGFQGGDCSERVCMYNWAWVTTANGDLNFNGNRWDGAVYSADQALSSMPPVAKLTTDAAPGGTWESWPYNHQTGNKDEGHFYMECSNRGICDRETGLCKCFEGYSGVACRRSDCPNQCSGHGVCDEVVDYKSDYAFWDGHMSRSCKCDPGYTGPSCEERVCPKGNDPLTAENEIDGVQYVDIYSDTTTITATSLGGTASLTFTDSNGKAWETGSFSVQTYDGSTSANAVATDAATALKNLPNGVVPDVTVTAGYCEAAHGTDVGHTDNADGVITKDSGGTAHTPPAFYRPVEIAAGDKSVIKASDGKVAVQGQGDAVAADSAASDVDFTATTGVITAITKPYCIRLKVVFTKNPGSVADLGVDVSLVTFDGKSNSQNANTDIKSTVSKELTFTSGATLGYPTVMASQAVSAAGIESNTAANKLTKAGAFTANMFLPGMTVEVTCDGRSLGDYTVSAASGTDDVTFSTNVAASDCSAASHTKTVTVTSKTHVFSSTQDLSVFSTSLVGNAFKVGTTAYTGTITHVYATYFFAELFGAAPTAQAAASVELVLTGDGTKEDVECGDRGMCDRTTGICNCFSGYAGHSCSEQNAIAKV